LRAEEGKAVEEELVETRFRLTCGGHAEVWSIFASHAEWIFSLVQNHKDLKSEVNGYSWESFLSKVPQLPKSAMLDEGMNGGVLEMNKTSMVLLARPDLWFKFQCLYPSQSQYHNQMHLENTSIGYLHM
jgi:hypothetical protein